LIIQQISRYIFQGEREFVAIFSQKWGQTVPDLGRI